MKVAGSGIALSVIVNHPDASAGAKIHNVTFYEYPSGRIIGWNYSATGWTNGQIVRCNSTYHLEYEGTKYYWYAKAMDDEYWSDMSDIYYVETYYNDTEPTKVYYSEGADIYVNPPYTESEPDVVYYSTGAGINVVDLPQYHNMQPENASTGNWLSVELSADVNKTLTDATYWDFSFQTNNTAGGSWVTIKTLSTLYLYGSLDWTGIQHITGGFQHTMLHLTDIQYLQYTISQHSKTTASQARPTIHKVQTSM